MTDAQGQLVIDFARKTRNSDPATSKKAEDKITKSGGRRTHCEIILSALRRRNGSTAVELAYDLQGKLSYVQISRRRIDLIENGYVKVEGERNGYGIWFII